MEDIIVDFMGDELARIAFNTLEIGGIYNISDMHFMGFIEIR
jgi:hypothetical protein